LAGEDDADDEARVPLEVGQDTQDAEHVGADVVGFIELCVAQHNSIHVECLVMWSTHRDGASRANFRASTPHNQVRAWAR
jgi:hypothetical protein